MHLPFYDYCSLTDSLRFEFQSTSESRTIQNIITYELVHLETQLYNLALVDVDESGRQDDLVKSNNQDMPKVLATVAQTMRDFFRIRPDAKITFKGSTPARTRLYGMAISKYYSAVKDEFSILGYAKGYFVPFELNESYESFIIHLKYKFYEESSSKTDEAGV